jgi:hypothetical protein
MPNNNADILIGVGGTLLGVIVTHFFNWLILKNDFQNKRLFEAHNKRIAVYDDVLGMLSAISGNLDINKIRLLSALDMAEIITKSISMLEDIIARLSLYGSTEAVASIKTLVDQIAVIHTHVLEMVLVSPGQGCIENIYIEYIRHIGTTRKIFTMIMSIETGNDFLNKKNRRASRKIAKILGRIGNKNNKPGNKFN